LLCPPLHAPLVIEGPASVVMAAGMHRPALLLVHCKRIRARPARIVLPVMTPTTLSGPLTPPGPGRPLDRLEALHLGGKGTCKVEQS
jgi:hypothetical protein